MERRECLEVAGTAAATFLRSSARPGAAQKPWMNLRDGMRKANDPGSSGTGEAARTGFGTVGPKMEDVLPKGDEQVFCFQEGTGGTRESRTRDLLITNVGMTCFQRLSRFSSLRIRLVSAMTYKFYSLFLVYPDRSP